MVDVWVHCETKAQALLGVWRTALPIERAGPCVDVAMGTSINYKLHEVFGCEAGGGGQEYFYF